VGLSPTWLPASPAHTQKQAISLKGEMAFLFVLAVWKVG
jgi:hypothetical protein